ncbi:MAG: nitrate/nitrite-specific signal transduction histidine kinase [Chlamydiales bacterium]|jgi:nitrate/nitrite-specific signal transduction histidine kinase
MLWETRSKAEKEFREDLKEVYEALSDGVSLLDKAIDEFERSSDKDLFFRLCALISLKSKNLVLALLSLIMEGLAQEGGAILRPLVECTEMLAYLRLHFDNLDEVAEKIMNRKITAGKIGKEIEGDFKDLRKYLNENASHLSLSYDSLRHCLDMKTLKLNKVQKFNKKTFLKNLELLFSFLTFLLKECSNCLEKYGKGDILKMRKVVMNKGIEAIRSIDK